MRAHQYGCVLTKEGGQDDNEGRKFFWGINRTLLNDLPVLRFEDTKGKRVILSEGTPIWLRSHERRGGDNKE